MLDLSPLWISLRAAGIATIITFFIGIAAARWMLTYRGKGKGVIDAIFIAPLVLPPTVVGFLLLLLLGRNSPIGQVLQQAFDFNIIFSWEATVITATVVAFPLMYRTSLGAFEQIDYSVFLAARTLGASEWRIFWQVMLPLSYRGLVAATILSFARALGEFGATLMLAGNIPGQTQTMPVAIFFAAESGDMETALIWVLILMGISMSVIIVVNFWAETKRVQQQGKSKNKTKKRSSNIESRIISEEEFIIPQVNAYSSSSSPELIVDIEKQLHGFTLDVNFRANHETLGLLGASGSGKSMTLRCIAGLETPDRGHISLNGRVLFDAQRKINVPSNERQIGFVFQNYALFPHLNVIENIVFGIKELPVSEQQQRSQKYIHLLELEGLEKRFPHQLSGGQQQRVALARALATAPDILIFDEALSALDSYLRGRIEQLLIKVLSGYDGVSLFVTHKLEEAYRVCKDILVLDGGEIIEAGRKEAIFEKPRTFKTAQLTECKNFSSAEIVDSQTIRALDWNCNLEVVEPIPDTLSYVGYRAHQFTFTQDPDRPNTFPCWLVTISETQHRVTLYIKLHSPPDNNKSYDLLVEVFREKWANLKNQQFPWYITLDPLKLILLED